MHAIVAHRSQKSADWNAAKGVRLGATAGAHLASLTAATIGSVPAVLSFSSVGVLVMGSVVEPKVYNSHITPGADECFGTACFADFHLVGACVAFLGFANATALLTLQRRKRIVESASNADKVVSDSGTVAKEQC